MPPFISNNRRRNPVGGYFCISHILPLLGYGFRDPLPVSFCPSTWNFCACRCPGNPPETQFSVRAEGKVSTSFSARHTPNTLSVAKGCCPPLLPFFLQRGLLRSLAQSAFVPHGGHRSHGAGDPALGTLSPATSSRPWRERRRRSRRRHRGVSWDETGKNNATA